MFLHKKLISRLQKLHSRTMIFMFGNYALCNDLANFFRPCRGPLATRSRSLWHGATHCPLTTIFAGPKVGSEAGAPLRSFVGITLKFTRIKWLFQRMALVVQQEKGSKLNATWRSLRSACVWCRPNWALYVLWWCNFFRNTKKRGNSIDL